MRTLLLPLILASCAPAANSTSPRPRPLAGTHWVLTTDGAATAGAPTLEFREAGRANGFTGCNQWFAQVDRSDGGLRFIAIGMTRRACEDPAMETEQAFASVLQRAHAVQVHDNELTLTAEDGELLATFERAN